MKKISFTVVFTFYCSSQILSQQREVIGRVLNKKTEKPIDSARVVVVGSTVESITNRLGYFKIVIDTAIHKSLHVTHRGFKPAEIVVPKENRFKFFLEEEEIIFEQPGLTPDLTLVYKFIDQNIKYPAFARRMGLEGRVLTRFEIDNAGHLLKIELVKGFDDLCNKEVTRVLSMLPPELAKSLREQTQSSFFILPVYFSVEGSFKRADFVNTDTKAYLMEEIVLTAISIKQEPKTLYPTTAEVSTRRGVTTPTQPAFGNAAYSTSVAGNGFGKGTILTTNGDTIKCLVEMAVSYEKYVHYKMTEDGKVKSLKVALIKSMTTPYKYIENIQLEKKQLLMGLVRDGKAKLFSHVTVYKGTPQTGFGGTYTFNTGVKVIYLLRKDNKSYELNKQNYKEVIVPILNDCPSALDKINNDQYNFDNLDKMIEYYNLCK